MKRPRPIRSPGLRAEILGVLTDKWQTSRLISLQVKVPPDAIARESKRRDVENGSRSLTSAKVTLVCNALRSMRRSGSLEWRKNSEGRYEYRELKKDGTQ